MTTTDFLNLTNESSLLTRNIGVYSFDTVDSTNSEARRSVLTAKAKTPALFIANTQTGGRGRMGRSFFSPVGTGIYMTLALDVSGDKAADTVRLTAATAVAVSRAIKQVTGITIGIKWVNDLYLEGKKVCGILAESFSLGDRRYALIGVGINLSTKTFPNELCDVAGSICKTDGARRELALAVCREIYDAYQKNDRSFMDEYRALSVVLGKNVRFLVEGETHEGQAVEIDGDGALLVKTNGGEIKRLCSGEITLRLSEVEK